MSVYQWASSSTCPKQALFRVGAKPANQDSPQANPSKSWGLQIPETVARITQKKSPQIAGALETHRMINRDLELS